MHNFFPRYQRPTHFVYFINDLYSNVFDINIAIGPTTILVKLKANTVLILVTVGVGLVDLCVLG
jgi:hypothetical protein